MGKNKAVKPTLEQKKMIAESGLIASDYLVMLETTEELRLVHRNSGRFRSIKKSPVPASRRGSSNKST